MPKNQLYYGDNLDILRRYVDDESVDLVYLDPPFNSNANYNVLFAERDGAQAAAQIKAFGDTWRWDEGAARAYENVVEAGGRVSQAMQAFRAFLGESDMLAYLAMMAPRLVELRRTLKSTGSLYLHCDPTASHYLNGGIHLTAPGGRIAVCLGPECTTRGTTPRCVHGFPTMPRVGTIWTGCAGLRVSDARPVTVRRAGSWAAESAVVRTVVGGCPAQPAPSSRTLARRSPCGSPQPGH